MLGDAGFFIFALSSFVIPIALVVLIVVLVVRGAARRKSGEVATSTTPRDAFIYLLTDFCLYVSAIGAITVIISLADGYSFNSTGVNEAVRIGAAALIVAFPAFVVLDVITKRRFRSGDMDPSSPLRLGLMWVTLFVIAFTAMLVLMFVINDFLGGELTGRAAIKAFGILGVSGLTFGYYLPDLRRSGGIS